MRSILLPRPSTEVANILNGQQRIVFSKTKPRCELPITVYIYCNRSAPYLHLWMEPAAVEPGGPLGTNKVTFTPSWQLDKRKRYMSKNGKIVAKFMLRKIEELKPFSLMKILAEGPTEEQKEIADKSCMSWLEIDKYMNHKPVYMWEIFDLETFDEAKELTVDAPQSWRYYDGGKRK